jgi:hypothetical protein
LCHPPKVFAKNFSTRDFSGSTTPADEATPDALARLGRRPAAMPGLMWWRRSSAASVLDVGAHAHRGVDVRGELEEAVLQAELPARLGGRARHHARGGRAVQPAHMPAVDSGPPRFQGVTEWGE